MDKRECNICRTVWHQPVTIASQANAAACPICKSTNNKIIKQ